MTDRKTPDDYLSQFSDKEKALAYALDIRKFEIELYWKRAAYFWTLLAASFAAYFALEANKSPHHLQFLVACIGLLLSIAWYLVNRGSKYWQENWERHVDVLGSEVLGPLYKTVISSDEYPWTKLLDGYPYSVSKINQFISLFISFVWTGIFVRAFPSRPCSECLRELWPWILGGGTLLFALLMLTIGISRPGGEPRKVNFRESPLDPPKGDENAAQQVVEPHASFAAALRSVAVKRPLSLGVRRIYALLRLACLKFHGAWRYNMKKILLIVNVFMLLIMSDVYADCISTKVVTLAEKTTQV